MFFSDLNLNRKKLFLLFGKVFSEFPLYNCCSHVEYPKNCQIIINNDFFIIFLWNSLIYYSNRLTFLDPLILENMHFKFLRWLRCSWSILRMMTIIPIVLLKISNWSILDKRFINMTFRFGTNRKLFARYRFIVLSLLYQIIVMF